jgi:hypothetical protein
MRRAILVFFGTLLGGLIFVVGIGLLFPVPDWGRAGKGIGILAVVFAVADACDGSWRRGARRRRPDNGPPPHGPAAMPPSPGHQASGEPASLPHVPTVGSGAATGGDEYTVVFRPHPEPMLACALCLAAVALLYPLAAGIHAPLRILDVLTIPGPLIVGVSAIGAAVYFYLFLRNCRPGSRIVVDTSGIILPGRGRVTWEEITTVKRCRSPYPQSMAPVQIELKGRRHVRIRWPHETGRFYEAVQACFEEHERWAGLACTTAAGMNRKEAAL